MRSGRLIQDFSSLKPEGETYYQAAHDGVVHFPLGAASYVYEKEHLKPMLRTLGLIPPTARFPSITRTTPSAVRTPSDSDPTSDLTPINLPASTTDGLPPPAAPQPLLTDEGISLTPDPEPQSKSTLIIHIGAQPNNSPHTGTIITFTLAFLIARGLQREYAKLRARTVAERMDLSGWVDHLDVLVQLDLVDTAPDSSKTDELDGIVYQRSHRTTGAMNTFLPDYDTLLSELSAFVNDEVKYVVSYQEALMRTPTMRDALRAIVLDRDYLAPELAPERECLAIRCACPVDGCGTADKHGILNEYAATDDSTTITFHCPMHGPHTLRLEEPDDRARVELNTPLRNLARTLVYMADTAASGRPRTCVHMRVTGADYQGLYQEQLLYRQLTRLAPHMHLPLHETWPVVAYAPLITDWSGGKLSKSLYVREDAYRYLRDTGMDWLLEFRRMREEGKDRTVLYRMVEGWITNPTMLFCRSYSLEYIRMVFEDAEREKRAKEEEAVPVVIGVKRKPEDEGER